MEDKGLVEKEDIYPPANAHHLVFIGICHVCMTDGNLVPAQAPAQCVSRVVETFQLYCTTEVVWQKENYVLGLFKAVQQT